LYLTWSRKAPDTISMAELRSACLLQAGMSGINLTSTSEWRGVGGAVFIAVLSFSVKSGLYLTWSRKAPDTISMAELCSTCCTAWRGRRHAEACQVNT